MNIQVNVMVDLSPRFENLLKALVGSGVPQSQTTPVDSTPPPRQPVEDTVKDETPAPDSKQQASGSEQESTDTTVVPLEELRAIARGKGSAVVKPILEANGYASVTAIPEDKRADFKAKLEAA